MVDATKCVRYSIGHRVHWIQANHAWNTPGRPCQVTSLADGWMVIELKVGEEVRLWCHNEEKLRRLIVSAGSDFRLRDLGVLECGEGALSVASAPSPCVMPNEVSPDASPVVLILQLGGFTLGGRAGGAGDDMPATDG